MSIHPAIYAAFFDELQKIAEEEKAPSKPLSLAKILGVGALGMGVGTAGGLLAGHLGNMAYQGATGKPIPKALVYGVSPLLGGTAGIAYAIHKAKEQEAIRSALENQAKPGAG